MRYSLINVHSEHNGRVDGYWIQNHTGTLQSATELASATKKINSGIKIAIVNVVASPVPILDHYRNLKPICVI